MKKDTVMLYIPGDSVMHRLDPRSKIISCILISLAVIINDSLIYSLLNVIALFICFFTVRNTSKRLLHRLRPLFLLFSLTILFSMFLTKGDVFFHFYGLNASVQGLYRGLSTVLRLASIFLSFTLLTLTTPPLQLIAGVQWIFSPLYILKVPVDLMALLLCVSLRFVPVIIEEAGDIRTAQLSRGAPLQSRNIFLRLKTILSLLIPLLASSLQRSDDLALAMESRCVSKESSVKMYKALRFTKVDAAFALIMFLDAFLFFGALILFSH